MMKYLFPAVTCALALTATETSSQKPNPIEPCHSVTYHCCPDLFKTEGLSLSTYGEFFYMQPNSTNSYYGASAIGITSGLPSPADIASPDWTVLEVNSDYHPGFEVGLGLVLNSANIEIGAN